MTRLSWVQPEDLIGHELRQAAQDGRAPDAVAEIAHRWTAAGGHPAPPRAGASPEPAPDRLRALARSLLDELDALPPLPAEPDDLAAIRAHCPTWPSRPPARGGRGAPGTPPVPGRAPGQGGEGARGGAGMPTGREVAGREVAGPEVAGPDVGGPGAAVSFDRLRGAWLGRAAGCVLGKPVEKIPREGIREIAAATGNLPVRGYFTARGLPGDVAARWPWNRHSARNSLAENLDGTPEDDDLNYPLLALLLLERYGRGFTTGDVAALWLDELPAGRTFTAERVAYRNLLLGLEPPATARHHNPFREWIGAQIRGDVFGWVNPGDPGAAAAMAWRDARLTHTANGLYGEMFAAALAAAALVADDVEACVRAGRSVVPDGSRMAAAIDAAVDAARAAPPDDRGWERVVDGIEAAHADVHWVHAVPNAALVAAALVHGRGDFATTCGQVVAAGWDTDSDGATVGGVLGALYGAGSLPAAFTAPLRDRLASSVTGCDGVTFTELAERTAAAQSDYGER